MPWFSFCARSSKLPTLQYPRTETDEIIYWQLARNLTHNGQYSLQGTEILPSLSAQMYDRPLFHHPPFFAVLLVPFVLLGSVKSAILVSWLGHLLCIIAVALIVRQVRNRGAEPLSYFSPIFWLPLLGVATDPILTFVSRKLWIDTILAGLAAMSIALILTAEGPSRRKLVALSGFLLGLAALSKLTALILVPVCLYGIFVQEDPRGVRGSVLAFLLPLAILTLPWFVIFYRQYMVVVPSWVMPDQWLLEHNSFMRAQLNRPWYYYFVKLPLLTPIAAVCLYCLVRERGLVSNKVVRTCLVWSVAFLAALTLIGANGQGFLMRYIAPIMTSVYAGLCYVLSSSADRPGFQIACVFCVLFGSATGAMYLLAPRFDEILSVFELGGFLRY